MLMIPQEYYGDDTRWFMATVVDNTPPYGMEGRIKISIHGIHSSNVNNIPHKDLPWAQVMMPADKGSSSGRGVIPQINPGSLVIGLFLDGAASQLPIVLGSVHRTEIPTRNQVRDVLIPEEPVEEAERRSRALKYYIDIGYLPHIAATIVGTMDFLSEGTFEPDKEVNGYYGLLRWKIDSNRYISLKTFTDGFSPQHDYRTFVGQLAFVAHELRTTQLSIVGKLQMTKAIKSLREPYRINCRQTVGNGSAATFVSNYFEKQLAQILESDINLIENKCVDVLTQL